MKQLVVLALVSFLAAVGGATWYTAYLSPPRTEAVPPVDSAPPRPAVLASRSADSAPPVDQPPKPVPAVKATATQAPADLTGRTERAKAVGRVLASMKPTDAVNILDKMTDQDVESIVRQLNAKQMASLLSAMPAERAAQLGRRLLQPAQP